jgi:hypothetical protein
VRLFYVLITGISSVVGTKCVFCSENQCLPVMVVFFPVNHEHRDSTVFDSAPHSGRMVASRTCEWWSILWQGIALHICKGLTLLQFEQRARLAVWPVLNPRPSGLCNSKFTLAVMLDVIQKARILKVVNNQKVWCGVFMKCSELY